MERDVQSIGAAVRAARERLRLSRPHVADMLEVSEETIKKIENGERVEQWLWLARVAEALNSSPNDFLGFPVVDPEGLGAALRPILAAFGHNPEDAENIARILLEAVEDAQSLQGDAPVEVRFRHAGEIAAGRFRRRNTS